MGMFSKVPAAEVTGGGVYFLEGKYKVEIEACKALQSRARDDLFIVECKILESTNSSRLAGTKASWVVKLNQDAGPGNVKGFVATATGSEPEEVDEAACELIVSDAQPLKGVVLDLSVVPILTRAGKPFSKHVWAAA